VTMNIFFLTLITAMATGFTLELLSTILGRIVSTKTLRLVLVLPASYISSYFLGVSFPAIWVVGAAASFLTMIVLRWLDKPVTIQNIRR
jgi:hypothetical protein